MLKEKPLSIQIWLWFILCIGISGILITSIIYGALESNLKEQLFQDIESQQQSKLVALSTVEAKSVTQPATMAVKLTSSGGISHVVSSSPDNIAIIAPSSSTNIPAKTSTATIGRNQEKDLYYVVSEQVIDSEKMYLYSFKTQNVRRDVIFKFWYVFIGILLIMLIMLIPAHIIAKKITSPLAKLQTEMQRIAKRKWHKPIAITGSTEFVDLAESCESMRQQLVLYDNNQQDMLQSLSHELKTPLMVIRSYIQATKDGYYPKGTLATTLDTIDEEAKRLQKKVLDLIYITNLDYLTSHYKDLKQDDINLKDIIEGVYKRLQYNRSNIEWHLSLKQLIIKGDQEHWKVVFENIIQNALRYCESKIKINLSKENDKVLCKIYNDGSSIDNSIGNNLFDVYQKGINGESGLGLNIVKRIVDLYQGDVWFKNEDDGVSFYISLPFVEE